MKGKTGKDQSIDCIKHDRWLSEMIYQSSSAKHKETTDKATAHTTSRWTKNKPRDSHKCACVGVNLKQKTLKDTEEVVSMTIGRSRPSMQDSYLASVWLADKGKRPKACVVRVSNDKTATSHSWDLWKEKEDKKFDFSGFFPLCFKFEAVLAPVSNWRHLLADTPKPNVNIFYARAFWSFISNQTPTHVQGKN